MARCPDCNKFVSYGEEDPEVQSEEIAEDEGGKSGTVTGDVRLVLTCADCSSELKETNLEFEIPFEHECGNKESKDLEPGDDVFSLDGVDAEFTSRQQTTDRKGKPIKNFRYMKTFYGADLTANITCNKCGESFSATGNVEEQASSFDDLT